MRKIYIASAAALGLAAAAPALAQQSQPLSQQGATPSQPSIQGQPSGSMPSHAGPMGTPSSGSTAMQSMAAQEYRSYNELSSFDGQIAGDHQADDLKDKMVVNRDGDEIGKIEDLAVDSSGQRVEHVVLDVGDYLDQDDRYILVRIDELERGQGDADEDQFVLDSGKDALRGMTAYEKSNDRWTAKSSL